MNRGQPSIVVIGATGYTGGLIARELARESHGGPPVILAGRDARRLERVAEDLGGADAALAVVDVGDPGSLRRLIQPGDAVINTAGPFTELGEPVVRACIERGAHYLDTTGEQPFMREMHARHDAAAREAGVAVVNAMAFEYALGDCALALAAREMDRPVRTVDVIYAWGGTASSRGTRRTALRMMGRRAWVRVDGAFRRQAAGSRHRTVTLASGKVLHAIAFGAGEVVTAPRHLPVETARGWLVMGSRAARLAPFLSPALPVLMPVLRPLLEPLVARQPDPTPGEREGSAFTIRIELENRAGDRSAVEVQGRDPYGLTAVIAARGARRALEPDAPAGVLAPAQLVDPSSFFSLMAEHGVRVVPDRGGA